MARITPLSGFQEWLPEQRIVELSVLERIRNTFELYGFAPLETRAVEPLDQLLRKGDTSKEVYLLRRLQADPAETDGSFGLHFDLTVPFARYVLENAGKLHFPFRRYQIQKAWRGERPQEGRYREFTQADIDVVDRDTLPFHYEVEMPLAVGEALAGLPIPPVRIQVNNRKLCEGFYRGLGIADPPAALRAIDKLDKIGPAGVSALLVETAGATEAQAKACLALAEISAPDEESRPACDRIARSLRSRGIPTEVAPAAAKYGKQIRFAERRGIPYVWFPGADSDEVKDIRSGDQVAASAETWEPLPEDLRPQVLA